MEPPPIPSVLMRGEWSLGKVLEVHWKYSMVGDTYLGRCLAGFDPDLPGFGVLPPHFKEGIENEYVREGMQLCYGKILERYSGTGIEGALLLFMASIVYHYDDFIAPAIANHSSHAFLNIPLLSYPRLLEELKKLVTLEPCGEVRQCTGVPRSTRLMDDLKTFYDAVSGYAREVRDLKDRLPQIIKEAVDEKAAESGHVTAQFVLDVMKDVLASTTRELTDHINESIRRSTRHLVDPSQFIADGAETASVTDGAETASQDPGVRQRRRMVTLYPMYGYRDTHKPTRQNKNRTEWDVPQDFKFPTADLYVAWTK